MFNLNQQKILVWLLFLAITFSSNIHDHCEWETSSTAPEVYWINMDKSASRKISMEYHLNTVGLKNQRVRGLTPSEIYVPDDIETTWRTAGCKLDSEWKPPNKLSENYSYSSSEYSKYSSFTSALCGRGKGKNTPKELGCTTSHLVAMRKAIYSTTAKSRYALIVEDDIFIPFNIDYEKLVSTAPKGFGILQLFNSNEGSMEATWKQYLHDKTLWFKKHPIKYFDFWSTCAYLIDRVVMKPVVDAVIQEYDGWTDFKIIAGINNPCVPYACCPNKDDNFIVKPPCVWAPRGYQADSFLYAMTDTYMLSIPIISNGAGGNQSTFHQSHVEMFHKKSFRRQRKYINELLMGNVGLPDFLKPACKNPLDINLL